MGTDGPGYAKEGPTIIGVEWRNHRRRRRTSDASSVAQGTNAPEECSDPGSTGPPEESPVEWWGLRTGVVA